MPHVLSTARLAKNTKKKPVRNGRSLSISHENITQKQLIEFGLSAESAKRAINVRRVLPYVEDPTKPCIDAKGLWSRLGKPHGQFRVWADRHIKPLMTTQDGSVQICSLMVASKSGSPTKSYTLSRNLAARVGRTR